MAPSIKPTAPVQATPAAPAADVTSALPDAPRRRGTGGLYPRLLGAQVSEAMYTAVKTEVARRTAAGEPSDVASIGAVVREAVSKYLNIPA